MSVSVICFTRKCGSNSDKTVILQIEGKVWIRTYRKVCSYISEETNGKVFKAHVACMCSEYQMNGICLMGQYNVSCLSEYVKTLTRFTMACFYRNPSHFCYCVL